MSSSHIIKCFVVALAALAATTGPTSAQGPGDLAVAPTRVVLEGANRSAAITVSNRGSQTAVYRINVVNMLMSETGEFKEIAEAPANAPFAEDLIRYSPSRVELQPGTSQTIRILLRKPEGLADNEYRSHLFIRGEPGPGAGRSIEQQQQSNELSIQLQPIFGVTIPVIVRHGALKVESSLSDFALIPADKDNPTPRLRFAINREGSASTFGDIRVAFEPTGKKDNLVVGELNGLAVYTPLARRFVEVRLRVPDGVNLANGILHVSYNRPESEGGRPIARGDFTPR